jgi:hypothetical protein
MASLMKFDLPLLDYNTRILLRQVKIHAVVAQPNLDVSRKYSERRIRKTGPKRRSTMTQKIFCRRC